MKARVQKWGNSLAVRIPRSFAAEIGIDDGTTVDISLQDGALVLLPPVQSTPTLDELLLGVTADNLHGEWETGPAVGREAW